MGTNLTGYFLLFLIAIAPSLQELKSDDGGEAALELSELNEYPDTPTEGDYGEGEDFLLYGQEDPKNEAGSKREARAARGEGGRNDKKLSDEIEIRGRNDKNPLQYEEQGVIFRKNYTDEEFGNFYISVVKVPKTGKINVMMEYKSEAQSMQEAVTMFRNYFIQHHKQSK